jgi:hypothetical protein
LYFQRKWAEEVISQFEFDQESFGPANRHDPANHQMIAPKASVRPVGIGQI